MSASRVLPLLALALGGAATAVAQVVRATGAPGTYQVVTVGVPAAVPADRSVAFQILASGTDPVLGKLHGELPAGSGAGRVVVLTIGVPAGARAGREEVARVRFSFAGSAIDVPVELEVARVRRASLVVAQPVVATRVGGHAALRYRLTNTGNAVDSFSVRATGPARWPAVPVRAYVVPAGSLVEAAVTLTVPRGASTGSSRIELVVSNGAGEITRAQATIEVVEEVQPRGDQVWLVTPGVATVLGDTASATPVVGLDLEGPVTNSVRLYGHLVQSAGLDAAHLWGLARVGYFPGTNFLSLTGPSWRLTGGRTTQTFSDVTGANFWGSGAAFSYSDPRWSAATLLGAPVTASAGTGASGGTGHLFGTQFGFDVGGGWVRGTATDAIEAIPGGRELRALGLGATSPPLFAGTLVSAEVAQRWFAAGQGLGWLAEAKRQGDDGTALFLRYTHAPGGSAAFAPARDMLTVYGARRLAAGIALNAGVWAARDTSPAFNRLTSSGWSVAPQVALTEWATLELEARSSRFAASDTLGTFGNSETDGRVGLTARLGRLLGTGSATLGRATRTTAFAGGGSIAPSADHLELSGAVQWTSPGGVFGATADYQQNGPGVGFVPRQYSAGLRVDAVPVPGYGAALFDAGVQRYDWFGSRPGATVVRFGLRAPVPGALVVRLDAEHNPLFLASVSSGWNLVLKLERPTVIRTRPATVVGMVYEDLNGNGRRDAGEPAVQGALVRRDGESVITDANGAFRFFRQADVPAELDESSLPFGLVASPANQSQRGERRVEIGVTPTAPVVVHLVLTVPEGAPAPRVDLHDAAVQARDGGGNVWSARADSSGTAVFHALPPGQYRIELDLTGLQEPLSTRGDLPGFTVEAGREVPALTIPLYPRPIRFAPPAPRGPGHS